MLFRKLPALLAIGVLVWACSTKNQEANTVDEGAAADRRRIDSLEKILVKHTGQNSEKELQQVLETVRSYQNYSIDYPRDTATAEYLLKAGQINYSYLKDLENAEDYLNRLVDSFPQARQRPVALLLLGNTYQDMGDTAKAIDALHILEREYENTEYNRMAQDLIGYIRRTTPAKEERGDQPPLGSEPKIQ